MPKEVISLQLGNFSNYVGCHWWNIQESSFVYDVDKNTKLELDHDVLFREGHNSRSITYTPRLVLVDFDQNLGCLPRQDTLYNFPAKTLEEEQVFWNNPVEICRSTPKPRNEFLQDLYEEDEQYNDWFCDRLHNGVNGNVKNGVADEMVTEPPRTKLYFLDQVVQTWTDYKKTHYHPRSAITFNIHGSETFNSWISGINHFQSSGISSRIEETVRFFAEECDTLQGFHLLCDLNNGFGGVSCQAMEYLHDEFGGKTFAVFPTCSTQNDYTFAKSKDTSLTSLLTLSGLLETSSFICPISMSSDLLGLKERTFPHLLYNAKSNYHTSSVLASCLESATRPYRLKTKQFGLGQVVESLVSGSRKLLAMGTALPLPFDVSRHTCLFDLLLDYQSTDPWNSITPNCETSILPGDHCYAQALSLCGLTDELMFPTKDGKSVDHEFKSYNEMIKRFLSERFPSCTNYISVANSPINTVAPFPHIFKTCVARDGLIQSCMSPPFEYASTFNGGSPRQEKPRTESSKSFANENVAIDVQSVPVLTTLQSSSNIKHLLRRCRDRAIFLKKWVAQTRHSDAALEQEIIEESIERFRTLQQDYSHLTEYSDSDDDSD